MFSGKLNFHLASTTKLNQQVHEVFGNFNLTEVFLTKIVWLSIENWSKADAYLTNRWEVTCIKITLKRCKFKFSNKFYEKRSKNSLPARLHQFHYWVFQYKVVFLKMLKPPRTNHAKNYS